MFWNRKPTAAEEAEAKVFMDALDATVNGKVQSWTINLQCFCTGQRNPTQFTQNPLDKTQWICPGCNGVLKLTTLRAPDAKQ